MTWKSCFWSNNSFLLKNTLMEKSLIDSLKKKQIELLLGTSEYIQVLKILLLITQK